MDAYSLIAWAAHLYGRLPASTPLLRGWALPPLFLVLELTYRCNLRCPFCYLLVPEAGGPGDPGKELAPAEIASILDQTPPWTLVLLSGGEILVRRDFPEILRTVTRKRRCHIFTNGTLVTPACAAEWVALGVSSVAVSVEGPEDVHDPLRGAGTFAKAITAIRALVEQRARQQKRLPLVNLKTTITVRNAGRISESVRVAEEAGADYCTFQVLNTTTRLGGQSLQTALDYPGPPPIPDFSEMSLDHELRTIERLARTSKVKLRLLPALPRESILAHYRNSLDVSAYTCVSPWTVAYVSPFGDVYPCLNFRAGNVRQESLRQIWNNRHYRQYRKAILDSGLFPDCRGCCDLVQSG